MTHPAGGPRRAGGCVECGGGGTAHIAPSGVLTNRVSGSSWVQPSVTANRCTGAAAGLRAACATDAWIRTAPAAARASAAASSASPAACRAAAPARSARSAARSAASAAAASLLRFEVRLLLRLRLPRGGPRARFGDAARGRCGRSGKMHAMPRAVRQHVSVWPAKGS